MKGKGIMAKTTTKTKTEKEAKKYLAWLMFNSLPDDKADKLIELMRQILQKNKME